MKFTVKCVIRGKFCILHFVRVINEVVGEKYFVSEVLYSFKN